MKIVFQTNGKLGAAFENMRADALMRKLRRFAIFHNSLVPPCNQIENKEHWTIAYWAEDGEHYKLVPLGTQEVQTVGEIAFNSDKVCADAIERFCDELIWYFTKYRDVI